MTFRRRVLGFRVLFVPKVGMFREHPRGAVLLVQRLRDQERENMRKNERNESNENEKSNDFGKTSERLEVLNNERMYNEIGRNSLKVMKDENKREAPVSPKVSHNNHCRRMKQAQSFVNMIYGPLTVLQLASRCWFGWSHCPSHCLNRGLDVRPLPFAFCAVAWGARLVPGWCPVGARQSVVTV